MKPFLIAIAVYSLCFISCESSPRVVETTKEKKAAQLDSFSRAKYGESADEHVKKMVQETMKNALFDTVGLSKSPIKVISAKIVQQDYSTFRSVKLRYKNISGKAISGIRFKWYGTNAFNEPADLGNSFAEGFGAGFTDEEMRAGKVESSQWDVLSRDAKKIQLAWPYEVSFADGTSWKLAK